MEFFLGPSREERTASRCEEDASWRARAESCLGTQRGLQGKGTDTRLAAIVVLVCCFAVGWLLSLTLPLPRFLWLQSGAVSSEKRDTKAMNAVFNGVLVGLWALFAVEVGRDLGAGRKRSSSPSSSAATTVRVVVCMSMCACLCSVPAHTHTHLLSLRVCTFVSSVVSPFQAKGMCGWACMSRVSGAAGFFLLIVINQHLLSLSLSCCVCSSTNHQKDASS